MQLGGANGEAPANNSSIVQGLPSLRDLPSLPILAAAGSDSDLREIPGYLEQIGFSTVALACYADFWELDSQQHFAAFVFGLPATCGPSVGCGTCEVCDTCEVCGPCEGCGAKNVAASECALLERIVTDIRRREPRVPIFLLGKHEKYVSKEIIRHTTSFYKEEITERIAQNIAAQARNYLESCLPVFFRHLIKYARSGADSWHCPGHSGGAAFLKSPAGQLFHRFFGENLLRADVCNAVESLGQPLEHSGPIGESERNAARIFGADRLYFVTNGTSASNQIVAHANLSRGDWVLVDRGCHQSILHAIIQTGALPVFLRPTCNAWGIVGPIPEEQFCAEWIQAAVRSNPLARSAKAPKPRPRAMILTQGTYDGILYNAQTIQQNLDGYIAVLHFDEAWAPHAAFHDFYSSMHAMGGRRARHSTVYATQSCHKMLCGLSQASQILVRDAGETPLDPAPLEAAFLMHSSTSPQYSILASLDVNAAMMGTPHGRAMIDEAIREALHFRRELRQTGESQNHQKEHWWFRDWAPSLNPENWGGCSGVNNGAFHRLDPTKCTLLMPGPCEGGGPYEGCGPCGGLNEKGGLKKWGIPAPVVSRYLEENGIIVEKTGFYSILVLFTIGTTQGRQKALLRGLQHFHTDYEAAAPLPQVMPQLCAAYPQYAGWTLPQLCHKLHECYRNNRIVEQSHLVYSGLPQPRLTPGDAYAAFVRGQYERLAVSRSCGRVSASMISIYPPGIPLVFPGEVISRELQQYLLSIQTQQKQFPGFPIHIHGAKMHDSAALFVNVLKL